jgi:hypothetical protein
VSIKLPRALDRIFAEPTWPGTLPRALEKKNLGVDYDTAWTRSPGAKAVRKAYQSYVSAPVTRLVARPTLYGEEHLSPLIGPVIFQPHEPSRYRDRARRVATTISGQLRRRRSR